MAAHDCDGMEEPFLKKEKDKQKITGQPKTGELL